MPRATYENVSAKPDKHYNKKVYAPMQPTTTLLWVFLKEVMA